MIESILIVLLFVLIVFGLVESYFHRIALEKLPIRIHVNGSRGKSSVTRLIAAGLRAGGLNTLAKTTGTSPRIIDEDGKDRMIHRLRSASIGEQVKLIKNFSKAKPDAVVFECMAVNPQYQWVAEHKMIHSTISVITNVRPDHLDEMGHTLYDNAMSLSNTIPFNSNFITVSSDTSFDSKQKKLDQKILDILKKVSTIRKTNFHKANYNDVSKKWMEKFKYMEHQENVSLALKVCELCGIDKEIAFDGMIKAKPDPGATVIWKINYENNNIFFINLMAANDPESTYRSYVHLKQKIGNTPVCIFLNTRHDRRYRTNQLLSLIYNKIKPESLIIKGDNFPTEFEDYKQKILSINVYELPDKASTIEVISQFSLLDGYYIIAIGNMVGWGEQFIKDLRQYKYD